MTTKINHYAGRFAQSNYKTEIHDVINELYAVVKTVPIEDTIENARLATDAYVSETGDRPDVVALDRMSTLIQNDYYTDPNPYKMSQYEYPSLTETMREEREKGETSDVWTQEIGVDGVDYRSQRRDNLRKIRLATSKGLRDKDVHARNKERRNKYHAFTKTQPVYTYFIPPRAHLLARPEQS